MKELGSYYVGHELTSTVKVGDRNKVNNSNVLEVIRNLHLAIANRHTIKFTYGKYDLNLKFSINRGGAYYLIEPHELFWYQDNYYLIGKSQDDWKHFRVDRIV